MCEAKQLTQVSDDFPFYIQPALYITASQELGTPRAHLQPPVPKVTGFFTNTHVNTRAANSEYVQGGDAISGSDYYGSRSDLKTLLAEYGDFRINNQWDPLRSRESSSFVVTNNGIDNGDEQFSSYSYTSHSILSPHQQQHYFLNQESGFQNKVQTQENGLVPCVASLSKQAGDEQGQVRMGFIKPGLEQCLSERQTDELIELDIDGIKGNKCDGVTTVLTQGNVREGTIYDSDDQCGDINDAMSEDKSEPIPIPSSDRSLLGTQGDLESQNLMQAMMDSFVKPLCEHTEEHHKVVVNYTSTEKLKITEADLSMALMKIQELFDQFGQVMNQNEYMRQQLQDMESNRYTNVYQIHADAYEQQLSQLREELSYYRESCDEFEEMVACQQIQIEQLDEQVAQLSGMQQCYQQKLQAKEDINLAMHNRNDELSYQLEMTKEIAELQREELLQELEAEIDNSATAQENHIAEMEYMLSKQKQLEEHNKMLCAQIATLQKQQEQSIIVAPVVRAAVQFLMGGVFEFVQKFSGVVKYSLRLFFHDP